MMAKTIASNCGFDGRRFLTESEWNAYRRRKPVRYIRKRKDRVCSICGRAATTNNPLQNAHRVGFELGIIYFALTPDFLDGNDNIVTAHRRSCNAEAELDFEAACWLLYCVGVDALPAFLPDFVHDGWQQAIAVRSEMSSV